MKFLLDDLSGEPTRALIARHLAGMRAFLGRGVGRALLEYLIAEARACGMQSLWLETGSSPAFVPALRLYASAGFVRCGPVEGYTDDPFSVFMTRSL